MMFSDKKLNCYVVKFNFCKMYVYFIYVFEIIIIDCFFYYMKYIENVVINFLFKNVDLKIYIYFYIFKCSFVM